MYLSIDRQMFQVGVQRVSGRSAGGLCRHWSIVQMACMHR